MRYIKDKEKRKIRNNRKVQKRIFLQNGKERRIGSNDNIEEPINVKNYKNLRRNGTIQKNIK